MVYGLGSAPYEMPNSRKRIRNRLHVARPLVSTKRVGRRHETAVQYLEAEVAWLHPFEVVQGPFCFLIVVEHWPLLVSGHRYDTAPALEPTAILGVARFRG